VKKAIIVELLQDTSELDDFGRDMVKTKCDVDGVVRVVYVQHPTDNRLLDVGYKFDIPN
jgi:hypothetical protein